VRTPAALLALALLLSTAPLQAQKKAPAMPQDEASLEALALKWKPVTPKYTPDPRQWKLEILTPLGGWMTEAPALVEARLTDPKDPAPPKRGWRYEAYDEDRAATEPWVPDSKLTPEQRQARNAWTQLEQRRNKWRLNRRVEIWFNGQKRIETVSVGQGFWVSLEHAEGENRLELVHRGSGSWQLRSWWTWATRDRLQVRVIEEGSANASVEEGQDEPYEDRGGEGDLRVVEPDGTVADQGNTPSGGRKRWHGYSHGDPLPGTYTVRWKPQSWDEDGERQRQLKPRRVAVEVLLDAGTDKERRWRFEQLVMPGKSEVVLGSFDVEE
jgi:hypothetical protein